MQTHPAVVAHRQLREFFGKPPAVMTLQSLETMIRKVNAHSKTYVTRPQRVNFGTFIFDEVDVWGRALFNPKCPLDCRTGLQILVLALFAYFEEESRLVTLPRNMGKMNFGEVARLLSCRSMRMLDTFLEYISMPTSEEYADQMTGREVHYECVATNHRGLWYAKFSYDKDAVFLCFDGDCNEWFFKKEISEIASEFIQMLTPDYREYVRISETEEREKFDETDLEILGWVTRLLGEIDEFDPLCWEKTFVRRDGMAVPWKSSSRIRV